MSKVDDIATELNNNSKDLRRTIKSKAFDVIGVALVIGVGLVSLGAITLRNITLKEVINIFLEAIPFYFGSVTLAMNYYRKGVYAGKESPQFIECVTRYSNKVNKLNGKQLEYLNDFCGEYNDKALKMAQENLLRNVAIRYDKFNDGCIEPDGRETPPLKQLSKEELVTKYNARVAEYVIKARDVNIKGVNVTILLGNCYDWDITNLGPNERELAAQRRKQYAGSYAISIFLLSLMAVKNILEWGWVGFILIAFKLIYILCNAYMKYFEGYDDATIRVTNHMSRKTDILKQYDYWYYLRFPRELNLLDPEYAWLSNISDNSIIYYNEGSKTGDDGNSPKNVKGALNESQ